MTKEELFAEWARLLEIENRELEAVDEEPLTADEFFRCRAEDVMLERVRLERLRVERWHATYNAALTGMYGAAAKIHPLHQANAHKAARAAADTLHGELKP